MAAAGGDAEGRPLGLPAVEDLDHHRPGLLQRPELGATLEVGAEPLGRPRQVLVFDELLEQLAVAVALLRRDAVAEAAEDLVAGRARPSGPAAVRPADRGRT